MILRVGASYAAKIVCSNVFFAATELAGGRCGTDRWKLATLVNQAALQGPGMRGHDGQTIAVIPSKQLIVVHALEAGVSAAGVDQAGNGCSELSQN